LAIYDSLRRIGDPTFATAKVKGVSKVAAIYKTFYIFFLTFAGPTGWGEAPISQSDWTIPPEYALAYSQGLVLVSFFFLKKKGNIIKDNSRIDKSLKSKASVGPPSNGQK
jgi:hypothetical protein